MTSFQSQLYSSHILIIYLSWLTVVIRALLEKLYWFAWYSPHFMEPSTSLLFSRESTTCTYSDPDEAHNLAYCSFKILFDISSHLCLGFLSGCFPWGFPTTPLHEIPFSTVHTTCPAYPWAKPDNNILWEIQNVEPLTLQFFYICFFLHLRLVFVLSAMFSYTLSHVISITLKTKYGTRIKQQIKLNFWILYYCRF